MSIKRYDNADVAESTPSDWVKFTDHEADKKKAVDEAVKEKDKEIERLKAELENRKGSV